MYDNAQGWNGCFTLKQLNLSFSFSALIKPDDVMANVQKFLGKDEQKKDIFAKVGELYQYSTDARFVNISEI